MFPQQALSHSTCLTWEASSEVFLSRRVIPCHGSQINHLQTSFLWFHALTDADFGLRLDLVTSSMLFRTLPGPRNPAAFGPSFPHWPLACFYAHARMLPTFLKCVRWEDIFPFLAIGIPSIPRPPMVGTVWLVGVSSDCGLPRPGPRCGNRSLRRTQFRCSTWWSALPGASRSRFSGPRPCGVREMPAWQPPATLDPGTSGPALSHWPLACLSRARTSGTSPMVE